MIVALVVAAVIGVSLGGSGSGSNGNGNGSNNAIADEFAAAQARFPTQLADGFAVGEPDAPLVLTVWEDFQCPYCVRYSATVEPALIDEYVVPGNLRIEFRNFPILGTESVNAAVGSVCAAGQDAFWTYSQQLFLLQVREGQLNDEQLEVGRLDRDALIAAAGPGIDRAAFEQCLDDPDSLATAQDHKAEGTQLGVSGTPSFALNGQRVSNPPPGIEGWRNFIDSQLAAQE